MPIRWLAARRRASPSGRTQPPAARLQAAAVDGSGSRRSPRTASGPPRHRDRRRGNGTAAPSPCRTSGSFATRTRALRRFPAESIQQRGYRCPRRRSAAAPRPRHESPRCARSARRIVRRCGRDANVLRQSGCVVPSRREIREHWPHRPRRHRNGDRSIPTRDVPTTTAPSVSPHHHDCCAITRRAFGRMRRAGPSNRMAGPATTPT